MATSDKPRSAGDVPTDILPVIRASGVLTDVQFEGLRTRVLEGSYPYDARELAGCLIREGLLTEYQARRILKNKPHGMVVGKYVILERIGSGSMGRVYKAKHQLMDRLVALKIIAPEITSNTRVVARFQREMRMVGRLDHPNVVRAFDADQIGNVLYIVMEYVSGLSLGQKYRAEGPLPPLSVAKYAAQAALGPGPRPRSGDRPSRHQAVEPAVEREQCHQGPGPGPRRVAGGRRAIVVRDRRRYRRRHDRLHVAGASLRQGGRRP